MQPAPKSHTPEKKTAVRAPESIAPISHSAATDASTPAGMPLFLQQTAMPSETLPAPGGDKVAVYDNLTSHQMGSQIGAYGYSWRGNIFIGSGFGRPGAPSRSQVVQHEYVHALQARKKGPRVHTGLLESEAYSRPGMEPQYAADPDEIMGWWWIIPLAAGLYVLLRPNVANAPGPNDVTQPSVSGTQVAAEALAIFAVPTGVTGLLGRAGYGIIASFAISGAAGSVAYRGVEDVSAGEFSGVEAYVVDATTGAVIGVVMGGTLRMFNPGIGAAAGRGSTPGLVHLTDEAGFAGINAEQTLRGSQGIYALPEGVMQESVAMRAARATISPSNAQYGVSIPQNATPYFSQPSAIGPISAYQRMMGVYRAPAGSINMLTGEFTASGSRLANITGQFWPYGVDMIIWAGAGTMGSMMSPSSDAAYNRGLYSSTPFYNLMRSNPNQPVTNRSDGPFIFVDQGMMAGGFDFNMLNQPQNRDDNFIGPPRPPLPAIILVQPIASVNPPMVSTP